jgi:RHS repeat-associated protein
MNTHEQRINTTKSNGACGRTLGTRLLAAAIGLLFLGDANAQRAITHEQGWNPDRVFETGDVDNINLFNGSLSVAIPLGPTYRTGAEFSYQLSLHYSSEAWDSEQYCPVSVSFGGIPAGSMSTLHQVGTRITGVSGGFPPIISWERVYAEGRVSGLPSLPDVLGAEHQVHSPFASENLCATLTTLREREGAVALGWQLSLGQLKAPFSEPDTLPYAVEDNQSPRWFYIAPDGSEHRFYGRMRSDDDLWDSQGAGFNYTGDTTPATQQEGGNPTVEALRFRQLFEDNPDRNITYTRDSTFLRMRRIDSVTREIDFPNGQIHRFKRYDAGNNALPQLWRLVKIIAPTCRLRVNQQTVSTCEQASDYLEIKYCAPEGGRRGGDTCVTPGHRGWELTDNYGRRHLVHITRRDTPQGNGNAPWHIKDIVDKVVFEDNSASTERKVFDLEHEFKQTNRAHPFLIPAGITASELPPHLRDMQPTTNLPYLVAVTSRGNTDSNNTNFGRWRFAYRDDNNQTQAAAHGHPASPGAMIQMVKPTGAIIEWSYLPTAVPYVNESAPIFNCEPSCPPWGFREGVDATTGTPYRIVRGYFHPTASGRLFNIGASGGVFERRVQTTPGGRVDHWVYAPHFRCHDGTGPDFQRCVYNTTLQQPWSQREDGKEFINVVYRPGPHNGIAGEGGKSVHYFSIFPNPTDPISPAASSYSGQEYGLPISKRPVMRNETGSALEDIGRTVIGAIDGVPEQIAYVSTEFFLGGSDPKNNPMNTGAVPEQRTYLRYEHDPVPLVCSHEDHANLQQKTGCAVIGPFKAMMSGFGENYDLNRRVKASSVMHINRGSDGRRTLSEFIEVVNDNYDGFGHFQKTMTRSKGMSGQYDAGIRIVEMDYTYGPNRVYQPLGQECLSGETIDNLCATRTKHLSVASTEAKPWQLGLMASTATRDSPTLDENYPGGLRIGAMITQYCHERRSDDPTNERTGDWTGFVSAQRVLSDRSPYSPSTNDIVITSERQFGANQSYAVITRRYGGDAQDVLLGSICDVANPTENTQNNRRTPELTTLTRYKYGVPHFAAIMEPDCGSPLLITTDVPESAVRPDGLARETYAANGLGSRLSYDAVGRLVSATPVRRGIAGIDLSRLSTSYRYQLASTSDTGPGANWSRVCLHNGTGTPDCPAPGAALPPEVFAQELLDFDGHGRIVQRGRRSGANNAQVAASAIAFDALDRPTTTSVWGPWNDPSRTKATTVYDDLGRVIRTETPNRPTVFTQHDGYSRRFTRTSAWIDADATLGMCGSGTPEGTGCNRDVIKSQIVTKTGELLRVSDNSALRNVHPDDLVAGCEQTSVAGNPVQQVFCTYNRFHYDPAGRLVKASTGGTSHDEGAQTRRYQTDGRGFVLWEQAPEVGELGNDQIRYTYNSGGQVLTKRYGYCSSGSCPVRNGDLDFVYDDVGRVIMVADPSRGGAPLQNYVYATQNGSDNGENGGRYANGQLISSTQFNYQERMQVVVTRAFVYNGPSGELTATTTTITRDSGPPLVFDETLEYEGMDDGDLDAGEFGRLIKYSYPKPRCGNAQPTSCADVPDRESIHGYDRAYATSLAMERNGASPVTIVGNVTYGLDDTISAILHGNGVSDQFTYNAVGLLTEIRHAGTNATWSTGAFVYDGLGNIKSIGEDKFWYDLAGRLTRAELRIDYSSTTKQYKYRYDRFGNLTRVEVDGVPRSPFPLPDEATNRLTGNNVEYDVAGNQTLSNGHYLKYDALGRNVQLCGSPACVDLKQRFAYDVGGERVLIENRLTKALTVRLRNAANQVVREIEIAPPVAGDTRGGAWSWKRDFVFLGNRQIAAIETTGSGEAIKHYHLDHLGSTRHVTNSSGVILASGYREFAPYGEDLTFRATELHQFTGHERDRYGASGTQPGGQSDLDYMHARYFAPYLGRFQSTDPVHGSPAYPQSLNRYAFVLGAPHQTVDPDGRSGVGQGLRDYRNDEGQLHVWTWSDECGEYVPQCTSPELTTIRNLFVNGMLNRSDLSAINASLMLRLAPKEQFHVFHNGSSGGAADFVEASLQKLLGGGALVRSLSKILIAHAGSIVQIGAHSQGTIVVSAAMDKIPEDTLAGVSNVDFYGPAANRWTARARASSAGAQNFSWTARHNDAVGQLVSMSPSSALGWVIPMSAATIPLLFMGPSVSPHSHYFSPVWTPDMEIADWQSRLLERGNRGAGGSTTR